MPAPTNTDFAWETVAIPIISGVNVQLPERLVPGKSLLQLENARMVRGVGVTRRRGHVGEEPLFRDLSATRVASYSAPAHPTTGHGQRQPFDPDVRLPTEWMFGYGIFDNTQLDPTGNPESAFSQEREPGILNGAAARGEEALAWDGFRVFSKSSDAWRPVGFYDAPLSLTPTSLLGQKGQRRQGDAVMPWARVEEAPGSGVNQYYPDVADNGIVRVFASSAIKDSAPTGAVMVTVVDSETGMPLQVDKQLRTVAGFQPVVRAIPVGDYIHVLSLDLEAAGQDLHLWTLGPPVNGELPAWVDTNLGVAAMFDVRKVSETKFVVVRRSAGGEMLVAEFNANGTTSATNFAPWTTFNRGAGPVAQAQVGIAVHPVSGHICLVWTNASNVWTRVYSSNSTGVAAAASQGTLLTYGPNSHVTVEATYLQVRTATETRPVFRMFVSGSHTVASITYIFTATVTVNFGGLTCLIGADQVMVSSPGGATLASAAFRVGNRVYCWGHAREGGNLHQYVLYDDQLLPLGTCLSGLAVDSLSSQLHTVNWYDPTPGRTQPAKDRLVFHMGLTSSAEISSPTNTSVRVEARYVQLDFLPPLRSTKMGQVTYFPGAQLWSYDGAVISEGTPLSVPSIDFSLTGALAGGGLTASSSYDYRIYLAWTNAVGERVMSATATTQTISTGVGQGTISLRINPCVLRRPNAYYLIYRRAATGTTYRLVSSADVTSGLYAPASAELQTTFTDAQSDASIAGNEADPHNDPTLIPSFSAPSSEVIAFGSNRIWLAGGEIERGTVRCSKLQAEKTVNGFSPALQIAPERGGDPITAIGFLGTYGAFFTKNRCYALEDVAGPSNNTQGDSRPFPEPRIAFSDEGALSQESVVLLSDGLTFQSETGIRMMAPGGGLEEIGAPVDSVTRLRTVRGCLNSGDELRFYDRDGAVVMDRGTGAWSTWTGVGCVGAVTAGGVTYLVRDNGEVWMETEGAYTDASTPYQLLLRTAWLHAAELGDFQRVRRVGGVGLTLGTHAVTATVYMDEFADSVSDFTWSPPDAPAWGGGFWGSGTWGSSGRVPWRWRYRPSRQKCSVVGIEIKDDSPDSPGFVITGLLLEIGRRGGLHRTPWQTGQ